MTELVNLVEQSFEFIRFQRRLSRATHSKDSHFFTGNTENASIRSPSASLEQELMEFVFGEFVLRSERSEEHTSELQSL